MSSRCAYARITPADIRMMLMALRPIAFLTAAALLAACGPANDSTTKAATAAAPAILATPQGKDVNSYANRSEEHTSELQSLMRISYAVFCLKKKKNTNKTDNQPTETTTS